MLIGRLCAGLIRPGLAAPGCVISLASITSFNLDIMLSAGLDSKSGEKIDARRIQLKIFKSLGTSGSGGSEGGGGGGG